MKLANLPFSAPCVKENFFVINTLQVFCLINSKQTDGMANVETRKHSVLPEESPNAKAVLNGHHHHVFMGREGQSIIGGCSTHYQSSSVDPHHHLDNKKRTILVIESRTGEELVRFLA